LKNVITGAPQVPFIDEEFFRQIVCERIRALRRNAKLEQQNLADATGISKSTMCRIENGRKMPSAVQVARIAAALGVSNDVLLKETEDVPRH